MNECVNKTEYNVDMKELRRDIKSIEKNISDLTSSVSAQERDLKAQKQDTVRLEGAISGLDDTLREVNRNLTAVITDTALNTERSKNAKTWIDAVNWKTISAIGVVLTALIQAWKV